MPYRMEARDLSGGYAEHPVFQNLQLELESGKITVLIGANGSGKSTILKTMARLLRPDAGSVLLDGASIFSRPTREVARRLAILPQSAQAPESITVEELVGYGRFPHRRKMGGQSAEDREAVRWAMEATSLSDLCGRQVDRLSGGQRQRAWIAMALAQRTDILFLDEPTTFLDIAHQLEVLQLLSNLNREQELTIVMVLHDLNHAAMFAHEIVAIAEGSIVGKGSPESVITAPMLKAVFGVDAVVLEHPCISLYACPMRYRGRDRLLYHSHSP